MTNNLTAEELKEWIDQEGFYYLFANHGGVDPEEIEDLNLRIHVEKIYKKVRELSALEEKLYEMIGD